MTHPDSMRPRPGLLIPVLGGTAGILMVSAAMQLAPMLGFPLVDLPRLGGGVFTSDPAAAAWVGYAILIAGGALLLPGLFGFLWPSLPGPGSGFVACILKGLMAGSALWMLSGLLIPLAGWLNRLGPDAFQPIGLFGLSLGWMGAVALLVGHVLYGLALGLVSFMSANLAPIETIGWAGHRKAELPPAGRMYEDPTFPEYPPVGLR